MNDIERYNFWHSEMDAHVKKIKEDQAVVDFAKRKAKPINDFLEGKNICDLYKKTKGA